MWAVPYEGESDLLYVLFPPGLNTEGARPLEEL